MLFHSLYALANLTTTPYAHFTSLKLRNVGNYSVHIIFQCVLYSIFFLFSNTFSSFLFFHSSFLVYQPDHILVLFELRTSVSSYFCKTGCFNTFLTSMYQCYKNSQYILTDNLYPSIKSSHNHTITSHYLHSIALVYLNIIKIHTMKNQFISTNNNSTCFYDTLLILLSYKGTYFYHSPACFVYSSATDSVAHLLPINHGY